MKLRDCRWLCDESIQSEVISFLRRLPLDVVSAHERGLAEKADVEILRALVAEYRSVRTHDADFGTLAVAQSKPIIRIVHLRPGHISSAFTIDTMITLLDAPIDVTPPFIVVAQRLDESVRIGVRNHTI